MFKSKVGAQIFLTIPFTNSQDSSVFAVYQKGLKFGILLQIEKSAPTSI